MLPHLTIGQQVFAMSRHVSLDDSERNSLLSGWSLGDLLSQQCWCWGRDIERPGGNWLVETGFARIAPPSGSSSRSSIYQMPLPGDRLVILRGFGVLWGQPQLGGIFLPRFEVTPKFTPQWPLQFLPWSGSDLYSLERIHDSNRGQAEQLIHELMKWVQSYEQTVIDRLGLKYRRQTLREWDDGERTVVPAREIVPTWEQFASQVAAGGLAELT